MKKVIIARNTGASEDEIKYELTLPHPIRESVTQSNNQRQRCTLPSKTKNVCTYVFLDGLM